MLKGISPVLSPDLLRIIAAMGHGDELVIGDCNFPAETMGKRCVRADGVRGTELLDAVLSLFPLDTFVDAPVTLMKVVPGTLDGDPPIWKDFRSIVDQHQENVKFDWIDRFKFYERAKNAYGVAATTERALYACIIITKGTLV
ncbi:MAG: fucose isomerase [Treponema sp.]|jgi:L-fucose mutarotase|nr:fucose isomerase [Treponema sp.]